MARMKSTVLNRISGRFGDIVTYTRKGETFIKKYTKPSDPKTDKQLLYRAKFRLAMKTLHPFRPLIAQTFGSGQANYAKAMSLFLRNTITGEYPKYKVNWANLPVSPNNLDKPNTFKVKELTGPRLEIEWDEYLGVKGSLADVVILLIYNAELAAPTFCQIMGARKDKRIMLEDEIVDNPNNKIWVFFVSSRKGMPSVAIYCS